MSRRSTEYEQSEKSAEEAEPQQMYAEEQGDPALEGVSGGEALRRTQTAASMSTAEDQDRVSRILSEGSNKRDDKPLPKMGGGRDYPPELPERGAWRVDYAGEDDPLFPQNWPLKNKVMTCFVLGYSTFCASWGSAVFSSATIPVQEIYGIGHVPSMLSISLYILGFASGPILWGPMSELYGRKPPIVLSMFIFTCFNFAVATAKDVPAIMICRFFAGFMGASPLTVVAAAFSDLFNNKQRGTALSIFSSCVFAAPVLAPLVSAFITNSYLGWRWCSYITGIMGALALVLDVFFYQESYHPVILCRKAVELRRRTGNWGIYAPHEAVELDLNDILTKNVLRPLRMLFTEPILLILTLYTSFIYGLLYCLLSAFPMIFAEGYHMQGGVSELPYLSLLVGMMIAMVVMAYVFEPRYNAAIAQNNWKPIPEKRVPGMLSGAIVLPIGVFWLTWTGNYPEHIHWMCPTASGVLIGYSFITIFVSCFQYIIDAYLLFAASAIAGNTFLRSGVGAAFPLVTTALFHNLGTNWAGTLIGCLALIMVPIPLLFVWLGPRFRAKSKFAFVL